MAVEQDAALRVQELEQRQAGAELVHEVRVGVQRRELGGEEGDLEDEVELSQDGAQDAEAREDGRGHNCVAADADVEGACCIIAIVRLPKYKYIVLKYGGGLVRMFSPTISSFVKAVFRIAMTGEYDDSMSAVLQPDGCVDDQSFGTANA